jgi:Cys-tRNA(Pro) deacylase
VTRMAKFLVTQATKLLDSLGVEYTKHLYDYTKSGAVAAAELMGLPEHAMIKTLVMETNEKKPLIILMHGEKNTSLKDLARQVGVKNVSTASVNDAQKYTAYMVGGISPFGTRRQLPVYVEKTILELDYLYINGGRRGFILGMKPDVLVKVLDPIPVNVAI